MRFFEWLQRLWTVKSCVGCGKILSWEDREQAFCPECRLAWGTAEAESCKNCFQGAVECSCMTTALKKSGALCLRKAVFYHKNKTGAPPTRLIYFLKHRRNRRVEGFAAKELAILLRQELAVLSADVEQTCIAYVPRRPASKRRDGLDQAERMAHALSKEMGIPCVDLLFRRSGGREQKSLTATERVQNMKGRFGLYDESAVVGKTVILYDDVVTTGAGMAACTTLLRRAGAVAVLTVCLGQSDLQKR